MWPYDDLWPFGAEADGAPWQDQALGTVEVGDTSGAEYVAPQDPVIPIPRVPAHECCDSNRLREFADRVSGLLNDLLLSGFVVKDPSDGKYALSITAQQIADALGITNPIGGVTITPGEGINVVTTTVDTTAPPAQEQQSVISVNDKVMRVQAIGGAQNVLFIPMADGTPATPSGGAYLWVDSTGVVNMKTITGVVTPVAAIA